MADNGKKVVRRVKADTTSSSKKTDKVSQKKSVNKTTQKTAVKFVKDEKGREVSEKMAAKIAKKNARKDPNKKHFFLVAPFFAIGRYFRDSWRELRAVEWTNRRATWALTFAVLAFTAFFAIFVLVFDWLWQLLFEYVIL